MSPASINGVQIAELIRRSFLIANRAAIADIECEGVAQMRSGVRWYDVRPMLDEREHALASIDLARETLDYALMSGLIQRHAEHPYLVRIVRAA